MENKDKTNVGKKNNKPSPSKKKTTTKKSTQQTVKKDIQEEIKNVELEDTTKDIEIKDINKEDKLEETVEDIDLVFNTQKEETEEIAIRQARMEMEKELSKSKSINVQKKKKYKLNKKGIFLILFLILIVDAIFAGCIILFSDNSNPKEEQKEIKKKEKKKEEPIKDEEDKKEKDSTPQTPKDRDKYDQDKLKQLNDIDTKIDFFKYDNLDRYIAYKEAHKDITDEMVVVYVNIGLDKAFYSDIKDSPYVNTNKIIVNKYYAVSSDFEPSNLVAVNEKYTSRYLKMTSEAADAFNKMAEAASKEGYTVRAVSTYRSYSYQRDLYNKYAAVDGVELTDTYSARPGHSEHHTGLAVDVDNANLSYTSFGDSKEFTWMKENAYKYGYILRYTKANEWITGYSDEPWHYRYVGEEIAKYIQENPMTYEEYFVRFLDK